MEKIDCIQLNDNWNADPNSPEPICWVKGNDLIADFYANYYIYDGFEEGDRLRLTFHGCSKYSFNSCNDEGYYYGQYRTNPNYLAWGEFYKINSGLSNALPKPEVILSNSNVGQHYIFFFKDNTLEVIADGYSKEYVTKSKTDYSLLQMLYSLLSAIGKSQAVSMAGFSDKHEAWGYIAEKINKFRQDDLLVLKELQLDFIPNGKLHLIAMANGWEERYQQFARDIEKWIAEKEH